MPSPNTIAGTLLQWREPAWEPLLACVGAELAGPFMWMNSIALDDGGVVHAYKHSGTRRYLHLAEDGRPFAYTCDRRYRAVSRRGAIAEAFDGWEAMAPLVARSKLRRLLRDELLSERGPRQTPGTDPRG